MTEPALSELVRAIMAPPLARRRAQVNPNDRQDIHTAAGYFAGATVGSGIGLH